MCRTKRRVRSVSTLPKRLFYKYDFERRNRAMRYIKEEYDYISSIRRNNILFDMALYKLDQMIAEMESKHLDDPRKILDAPRIREQISIMCRYDPQYRKKTNKKRGAPPPCNYPVICPRPYRSSRP